MFCFVTVIYFHHDKVLPQGCGDGLILVDELVQNAAPASPFSTYFQKNSLASPACLSSCCDQVLGCISCRIIMGHDVGSGIGFQGAGDCLPRR